jgi:hypothetical protein
MIIVSLSRYGPAQLRLSLRMPVWASVRLSVASPAALENRAMALQADGRVADIIDGDPDPMIKIHVDFLDEELHTSFRTEHTNTDGNPGDYYYPLDDPEWLNFKSYHRHPPDICKCKKPLYHIGQDEAIFKQNALPAFRWSVKGRSTLRPKSDGQGVMVSGMWCERRGFGFPMTREEVKKINEARQRTNLPLLVADESPGLVFFQYGKSKEGYWDGQKFQEQCVQFVNAVEILYPTMQIVLEVDHSSGHLKEQSDGSMVNAMNVRWGGKASAKRDTVIEEGCLGPDPPVLNGRQLTIGSVQRMVFEDDSPPPFQDINVPKYDREMTPDEKIQALEKMRRSKAQKARKGGQDIADVPDVQPSFTILGYVGKNKGIFQILYERGLYKDKMKGRQTDTAKERFEMNGDSRLIVTPDLDAHAVLNNCTDFKFERTALQEVIESRGHILLPSVVCTPETAGGGIEYGWGKLKYEQRRENDLATRLEAGVKFVERVRKICKNTGIFVSVSLLTPKPATGPRSPRNGLHSHKGLHSIFHATSFIHVLSIRHLNSFHCR